MLHSFKISFCLVVAALLTSLCRVEAQNLRDGRALQSDPVVEKDDLGREYVKDAYIIKLKQNGGDGGDVKVKAQGLVKAFGGTLEDVYDAVLYGFSGYFPPHGIEGLKNNPNVEYIEPNYIVSAIYTDNSPASWGLNRIDQCLLPLDTTIETGTLGTNVGDINGFAYVIDTGIFSAHDQFSHRGGVDGTCSKNFIDSTPANWGDQNGHGTHVAATMCGKTYGVARNCRKICAVRVLDNNGSGYLSWVLSGINYVAGNAPPGSVANMSLGGGYSASENQAVNDAVAKGIVFVVSAGNDNKDACSYSPASATAAITVGATDIYDSRSYFSNFGNCVDIFAPGSDITSAWIGSTTASNTISGTSMASPHVAGLAMLYREQNSTMTPGEIRDRMLSRSSKNVVQSANSLNAHLAVVPTLKCGPCNEDGICQRGETAAVCIFDNCSTSCKLSGVSCSASTQCCSGNCRRNRKCA